MHKPQQGFTLLELMISASLGLGLLLAAIQLHSDLIRLVQQQQARIFLLRTAQLASLTLAHEARHARGVVSAGQHERAYPDLTPLAASAPDMRAGRQFHFFASSDWFILALDQADESGTESLWHLDRKTQDFGLAHKPSADSAAWHSSQTLIEQAELMRVRFCCQEAHQWLAADEVSDWTQIHTLQLAMVWVSPQPVFRQQPPLVLWGEALTPPDDGHLRLLSHITLAMEAFDDKDE